MASGKLNVAIKTTRARLDIHGESWHDKDMKIFIFPMGIWSKTCPLRRAVARVSLVTAMPAMRKLQTEARYELSLTFTP
jgi:hypothetical protein